MTLKDVGETLRAEREKKGLSLADVAQQTKVGRRILAALEEGDRSELPHDVYVKGFIRTYASVLGLDGEDLAKVIKTRDDALAPGVVDADKLPQFKRATFSAAPKKRKKRGPGLLLLLLLLAVAGWYFFFPETTRQADAPAGQAEVAGQLEDAPADVTAPTPAAVPTEGGGESTPDGTQTVPLTGAAAEATESGGGAASQTEGEAVPQDQAGPETAASEFEQSGAGQTEQTAGSASEPTAASPAAVETTESSAAAEAAESTDSDTEETEAGPEAGQADAARLLAIEATMDVWLRARPDVGKTRDFLLRPGQVVRVGFNETVELHLGNAGGVALTLDGEPYVLDARPGDVKRVTIPNDH